MLIFSQLAFTHDVFFSWSLQTITNRGCVLLSTYNFRPRFSAQDSHWRSCRESYRAIFAVRTDGFTVQNSMYALRHKQLQFCANQLAGSVCLLACRFSYKQIYELLRSEFATTSCIYLLRCFTPRYSTSMQSVCPYVRLFVCRIRNSLIYSGLPIFGIREFLIPCPVKKICHIFITFEVYILCVKLFYFCIIIVFISYNTVQ